jgi:hypothetical protein
VVALPSVMKSVADLRVDLAGQVIVRPPKGKAVVQQHTAIRNVERCHRNGESLPKVLSLALRAIARPLSEPRHESARCVQDGFRIRGQNERSGFSDCSDPNRSPATRTSSY